MIKWKWPLGVTLVAVTASLVIGCVSGKGGDRAGVIEAPKPTRSMASASKTDYDTLGRGYSAYIKQCGQCHDYWLPDDLSRAAWHKMNWNVGMEKVDEVALVKYLEAEIKTRK